MADLTLAQAMEWFGTDDAALNRRANAVRRYEADEQAGRVLAAEIRRRDAETCETCRFRSTIDRVWLCRNVSVPGHVPVRCQFLGNGCRAWQKREGE